MRQQRGRRGLTLMLVIFLAVGLMFTLKIGEVTAKAPIGSAVHEWEDVGPFPGNQVFQIAVNPQNSEELFAGGQQGVYRSRDGGDSWQLVLDRFSGFNSMTGRYIVIDPLTSSNIYVVSGETFARSQDGGNTWDIDSLSNFMSEATGLLIDPVTPTTLYLRTSVDGNYKSIDSGNTWTFITSSSNLVLNPQNPQQLFRTTNAGVFRSEDGGATWTQISTQVVTIGVVDSQTPTTLYGQQWFGSDHEALMKSTDGGVTWVSINGGVGFQISAFTLDAVDTSILYMGTVDDGVFRSIDGGATWTAINNNLPGTLQTNRLLADPTIAGRIYISYQFKGIYRSDTYGDNWTWKKEGLGGFGFSGIVLNPQEPSEVFTWGDTLYKSSDGANSWTPLTDIQLVAGHSFSQNPVTPTILYGGTPNDGVLKSTDGGGNWQPVNNGLPDGFDAYVTMVAVHPLSPTVVFANFSLQGNTYVTYDAGANWALVPDLEDLQTEIMAFHPTDPDIIYAGTHIGLRRSTDGGTTWTRVDTNLPTSQDITAIAIHPTMPTTIYIGIPGVNPVQKSMDGGVTWSPLNIGVVSAVGYDVQISPHNPDVVYAAVSRRSANGFISDGLGIFRSEDGGTTWATENVGIYPAVSALVLDPQNENALYAATFGLSAYKSRPPQGELHIEPSAVTVVHPLSNTVNTTLAVQLVNQGSAGLIWSAFVDGSGATCDAPTPVVWTTLGTSNGTVNGYGTTPLEIVFDSTALATGEYTATLCITGDAPDTPLVSVPLTLTVDDEANTGLLIFPEDFEVNLPSDSQAGRRLTLQNEGNAHLNWNIGIQIGNNCDINASVPWLTWSVGSGTTAPNELDRVGLTFDSNGLVMGIYTTTLCIQHNGLQSPTTIPLTLTVSGVPLTPTPVATSTATPSATPTTTPTFTGTATATATPTATRTPTVTATGTRTATATVTATRTATGTPAPIPTSTYTPTGVPTATVTTTMVPSATRTLTVTPNTTGTATSVPTSTPSATGTLTTVPTVTPSSTSIVTATMTPITATPTGEPNGTTLFLPLIRN